MSAPELLKSLLTAPGPPGHESRPARVWRESAEGFADEVTTDKLGSLRYSPLRRGPWSVLRPLTSSVAHATIVRAEQGGTRIRPA